MGGKGAFFTWGLNLFVDYTIFYDVHSINIPSLAPRLELSSLTPSKMPDPARRLSKGGVSYTSNFNFAIFKSLEHKHNDGNFVTSAVWGGYCVDGCWTGVPVQA